MFKNILPRFGIKVNFINEDDIQSFRDAVNDRTVAIFTESIGNPNGNVCDFEAIAEIAHDNKIMYIVDSTFTTPYLLKPFDWGADVVVHSATKYLGGHGTTMGGLLVDSGRFDFFDSGKYPDFTTPDQSYHGIVFAKDCGNAGYITRARTQVLRDTGACLSPFNAFLLLQGIETLSLRMERHCENALKTAQFLKNHPAVDWVNYPLLDGDKYNSLAKKYLPNGAGAIFSFGIKGGIVAGKKFINSLKLFSNLANVADAKSLIIHPATTTHSQLSEDELVQAGIRPEAIRISVGLESIDDILTDLDDALKA